MATTIDELNKLKADMEQYYSDVVKQYEEDEKFYGLDFAELLRLPRKFRRDAVILPTAREIVDTATDHIAPVYRRVTVPRRAATPPATEQSQLLQRFYEAVLTWLEQRPAVSPYRSGGKHLTLYGTSVWKLMFDHRLLTPDVPKREQYESDEEFEEAKADYNLMRTTTLPFTLHVLHPTEVYLDPFNDPPEWGMQVYSRYARDIKAKYPYWRNPKNLSDFKEADCIEWWDSKSRALIVSGEPALQEGVVEHDWGTHPYIQGASGYGLDGREHRPETMFVGMLRYLKQVLVSESRAFSISDVVLKSGAWPIRIAQGERANEVSTMRPVYGEIQPVPPGVEIKDLSPVLPPGMLMQFMQVVNHVISNASAPRVVQGLHQPGISSGFDRQLALGQARLRYGSLAESMEKMLGELCRKAGIMFESLKLGPVSLAAAAQQDEFKSITWKTFKGHHAVSVKINVLEPEDEVRKHQDAISLVAGGLMSPQTAIRKYFPDVDPESEIGRIVAARILFSGELIGLLSQAALQKIAGNLGLEEIVEQIMANVSQQERRAPAPEEVVPEPRTEGSRAAQAEERTLALREQGQ